MKIIFKDNKTIIENPSDFSLKHTFDCGQCFRFNGDDGGFSGVAFKKKIFLKEENNRIIIDNLNQQEFEKNWFSFFDLSRDYGEIKTFLSKDSTMNKAILYGNGIRILKQDFFECLISFIISQQNNIPRIKKAVEGFCYLFGEEKEYNREKYYTFPDPKDISSITEKDLEPLKLGYRNPYIVEAVRKSADGEIIKEELESLSYDEAKKKLLEIKGVGNKVADCILLFSLGKFEAFPVDTWIKKAMQTLYGIDEKNISAYKDINYGKYSGFAQQYIFYYMREKTRRINK